MARRLASGHEIADVVAEVFTTAWRRLDQIPEQDATRLWLYGVARHCVSNYHRGAQRRWRLLRRLTSEATAAADAQPVAGERDAALIDAVERLPDAYRDRKSVV